MSEPRFLSGQGPDGTRNEYDTPLVETTISFGALPGLDSDERPTGLSGAEQAAVDALPEASALLVVQRGPNAGARFLLNAERTTAGRKPDSDIFLDDVTVSRKHAEFVRRDSAFFVRDAGSLNGTYLAGDRIDEALLKDGDEVQIGKYRLVFHPSRRTS
ncbi:FHA domain-containing protein [Kineosporia succinea]|uniref:PSer/pThr/pTyr-binding forkhead associated (FHA) protein n=1 Tax=Kineosporia succinea TaxID=84632 RepID=A0ABT9P7T6_9ACTN|nr:FHA domain-containing protein [Kineosporia succinea]MDP9828527.1 pSer/pThr/pTyr-binding forkhead associated (FHA) protein [Kineosporia succinea]